MKNLTKNIQKGFSLIEILVAMVIIGILVAVVAPNFMSRPDQARIVRAKQDILSIQSALDLYKLDNGFYPSTDQGLEALVNKPTSAPVPHNWKSDGYLAKLPSDPWGTDYQYTNEGGKLRIYSYGPKGQDGNSEIGNWNVDEKTES